MYVYEGIIPLHTEVKNSPHTDIQSVSRRAVLAVKYFSAGSWYK